MSQTIEINSLDARICGNCGCIFIGGYVCPACSVRGSHSELQYAVLIQLSEKPSTWPKDKIRTTTKVTP